MKEYYTAMDDLRESIARSVREDLFHAALCGLLTGIIDSVYLFGNDRTREKIIDLLTRSTERHNTEREGTK